MNPVSLVVYYFFEPKMCFLSKTDHLHTPTTNQSRLRYCTSDQADKVLYPHCPKKFRAMDYRMQMVAREIRGHAADLIMLQVTVVSQRDTHVCIGRSTLTMDATSALSSAPPPRLNEIDPTNMHNRPPRLTPGVCLLACVWSRTDDKRTSIEPITQ